MFAKSSASWSLFLEAHRVHVPRTKARRSDARVLIFARDPNVLRWIDHELFAERVTPQTVESLTDVVTTLTLVPPPWPQVLIVEADAITEADAATLGVIRDAGWPGMVITIGEVSATITHALGVDIVLDRTLRNEMLRNTIKQLSPACAA